MTINVLRKFAVYRTLLLVCTAVLVLAGCGKIKEIRPTTWEMGSISPKGLYSVDINFKLGIYNPSMQIALSDIFAEVVVNGKVIGNVSLAPFTLEAKSEKVYDMNALLALNKGYSILNLLPLMKDPTALNNAYVNVCLRATLKNGLSKELRWDKMPVAELMKLAQ